MGFSPGPRLFVECDWLGGRGFRGIGLEKSQPFGIAPSLPPLAARPSAENGRLRVREDASAERGHEREPSLDDCFGMTHVQRAVAEQASALVVVELVVGLYERDYPAVGAQPSQRRGDGVSLRGPSQVDDDQIDPFGRWLGVQRVGALQHGDALVGAELPCELAVGGINGMHSRGAVLEQAIGKASGACAEIGAGGASDVDVELPEGVLELEPAPADECMVARRSLRHGLWGRR